jgi:hypothetical protein
MTKPVGLRPVGVTLILAAALSCTSSNTDATIPTPPPTSASESTAVAPPPTSPAAPAPLAPPQLRRYCHPGDPLVGVYSPGRLTVKNPCVAVTGVVWNVALQHDGDLHISLTKVDPKWLNEGNMRRAQGDLVVEIVPGIPVPAPAPNARITVIGPWVLDTETGWLEIHPVWTILPAG